ncbi:hypothetical protein L6261_00890 [Candidatus Parcubacteria bacterium]|nr:hypothetical protein [Candidatus Parcubacteria bacterium]
MKLNDNKNFRRNFRDIRKIDGKTPNEENCAESKILNVTEGIDNGIEVVLEKSTACFIDGNNEIAKQNLMKILPVIQKDYIGKNLGDLLNFEFNFVERIN